SLVSRPAPFSLAFSSLTIRPPPTSTLFPYTTLFRSLQEVIDSRAVFEVLEQRPYWYASGFEHQFATDFSGYAFNSKGAVREPRRSEEHTSELQSLTNLVCRLLLEKKKETMMATHLRH